MNREQEALSVLRRHYNFLDAAITAKNSERAPTDRELAAINQLCAEFDYGYSDSVQPPAPLVLKIDWPDGPQHYCNRAALDL